MSRRQPARVLYWPIAGGIEAIRHAGVPPRMKNANGDGE
jgi:hypothetical protein